MNDHVSSCSWPENSNNSTRVSLFFSFLWFKIASWIKTRFWSAAVTEIDCTEFSLSLTLTHLHFIWLYLSPTSASYRLHIHCSLRSSLHCLYWLFLQDQLLSLSYVFIGLGFPLAVLSSRLMIRCLGHLCYPLLTALTFACSSNDSNHFEVTPRFDCVCMCVWSAHLSKAHPDMIQTWYICWPLARNQEG